MRRDHAVVLLTHLEIDPIHSHFERLRHQAEGQLDVFLCVHTSSAAPQPATRLRADFRAEGLNAANSLAGRYRECLGSGGTIIPGFTDLVYMPVLLGAAFEPYDYIWLIEYDVDYAGDWRDFFAQFAQDGADLIGTTLLPRSECPGWQYWSSFQPPGSVRDEHHFRSFIPILRFSRRMLHCYEAAMRRANWCGHTEALFPTIALSNALQVEDMGGWGPLTPPSLCGRNYLNTPNAEGGLAPGTMIHGPVEHFTYFHETPDRFPQRGYLHHPVKAANRAR